MRREIEGERGAREREERGSERQRDKDHEGRGKKGRK
jgi:hypothetical protein